MSLRVVFHLQHLGIGGLQVVATDLATALQRRGHDMHVVADHGPLVRVLADRGVRVVVAPSGRSGVDPGRVRRLRAVVRRVGADVVHAFETKSIVEGLYATLGRGTVLTGSSMTPFVPWFLPGVPLTMPTRRLTELVAAWHDGPVQWLPPTVDVDRARVSPPAPGGRALLDRLGLPDIPTVVLVTRLDEQFKGDAVRQAIGAVALARATGHAMQLLVVGDGPARASIARTAAEVNRDGGGAVVTMVGAMAAPDEAYDVADVVLGSGTSLLRGMARGTPAICLGRAGYSVPVDHRSAPGLGDRLFYGVGDGTDGTASLAAQLTRLLDPVHGTAAAAAARDVADRHAVAKHIDGLEQLLREAVRVPRPLGRDAVATPLRMARWRRASAQHRCAGEGLGLTGAQLENYVLLHLRNERLPTGLRGTWPEQPTPQWGHGA